jgi:hypothetical protein
MIRFSLICEADHEFEAWFASSADFEDQSSRKLVTCPACGSHNVSKALMAPNLSTARAREKIAVAAGQQAEIMRKMQELSREMRANAENVGEKFAEEARRIHFGEIDPRGIYGKASRDEVSSLLEDGVSIMPLPDLPEDAN